MMRHALWVLEQQQQLIEENTEKPFHESWSDAPLHARWVMAGMAIGQSAVISGTPYFGLIQVGGYVDEYVWARTAPQWAIKEFRFGPGIKGVQAIGWSQSKRSLAKLGLMKVASRFIPYAGWALLAYDVYGVAKWAHEKYS